jgi:Zn finger protein HypA/HybF involved in hydrogenase expression
MAEEVLGKCDCGFTGSAILGGVRANYLTEMPVPHRCLACMALVTVDVWGELICPDCSSTQVESYATTTKELPNNWLTRLQYGKLKDSELFEKGFHRHSRVLAEDGTVTVLDRWHTCPRCEKRTFRLSLGDHYD